MDEAQRREERALKAHSAEEQGAGQRGPEGLEARVERLLEQLYPLLEELADDPSS